MTTIVGLAGSLRSGSFNARLLDTAIALAPAGLAIEKGTIRDIPLYDADVETASGIPPVVAALKDRIAAADGLLLVTPEYNGGIPGVFKNAIDWLSRPAADIARVFGGKPVAIAGATPGQGGTMLAQAAWLPVLKRLGAVAWPGGSLMVSGAGKAFDDTGLVDEKARENLVKFLTGFAAFAGR